MKISLKLKKFVKSMVNPQMFYIFENVNYHCVKFQGFLNSFIFNIILFFLQNCQLTPQSQSADFPP